jgi:Fe-S cluster biogenesis protein NfuA
MIMPSMSVSGAPKIYNPMNQESKYEAVAIVLKKVQPAMEVDGGGIASFTVSQEDVVAVRFKGTCLFCPSQALTLRIGIKQSLCKELPWVKEVIAF